jgi:hypothetical protein
VIVWRLKKAGGRRRPEAVESSSYGKKKSCVGTP